MRRMHWSLSLIGWGFIFTLLLPACTAPTLPTNQPTTQPADPPPANLHTHKLANLHHAAYNYARHHTLALRQVYPEREVEGLRTGSPTTSWALRQGSGQASSGWPRCAPRWSTLRQSPSARLRTGSVQGPGWRTRVAAQQRNRRWGSGVERLRCGVMEKLLWL